MNRATVFRIALLSLVLAALAGCSSVGDLFARKDPNAEGINFGVNPRQTSGTLSSNPSDKPTVLPVAAQDINCPSVDIAPGGAALRVGGADNASVRYQFNIGDTARQCDPGGPLQASLRIGVAGQVVGQVVVGPAGAAGTYTAPLKITVTRDADKKEMYSQVFNVAATTDGVATGAYRLVTDPILLPMPTLQLADLYSITVGFEGGTAPAEPKHRGKAKKAS
jgi:hypothetical protein